MAVQFCLACGDLLPETQAVEVKCECCGKTCKNELLNVTTVSSTSDFPSILRQRRGAIKETAALAATDTWSTIDTQCPECHAGEVKYTTLQLRSADEGTTMFYFCPNCSKRWGENN